jgi:hypothetical protein
MSGYASFADFAERLSKLHVVILQLDSCSRSYR